jgi:hypothetical protein
MPCPDELTLDLWSAQALPGVEADVIAAHVASCARCTAQLARWQAAAPQLGAALQLDEDERAYLASLDLAASWRTRSASAGEVAWGWLALLGVIAAFVAWSVAGQPVGAALGVASQVGLSTVLLTTALSLLLGAGRLVVDIATNPALGLSQPLLAVLALALLFWPRIKSAPHYLQGVHS